MNTISVIAFEPAAHNSSGKADAQTFAAELYVLPGVQLPLSYRLKPQNVRQATAGALQELEESLVNLGQLGFDTRHLLEQQRELEQQAERLAPDCIGAKAVRAESKRSDAVAYSRCRRLILLLHQATEERTILASAAQAVTEVHNLLLSIEQLVPRKFRWRGKKPDDEETIRALTFCADPGSHLESALGQAQAARRLIEQGEAEEALALIETLAWMPQVEATINEFIWKHQALEVIDCDGENLSQSGKETK